MVKVTVLGAGGGVGQALSLQLRLSPRIDELALYDRNRAAGAAVDLSHIPVKQIIKGYKEIDNGLTKALTGADVVIVTAGPPVLLSGDTKNRNDLLKQNCNIIGPMIKCCGEICPAALIMIVTNPVNAIVPFAAEILKKQNVFDPRRLFGVTILDVVRAETFLAEMLDATSDDRAKIEVNVVGGHSAETMVPLFSQADLAKSLSSEQLNALIYHVQYGGVEVYLAKGRRGAATLSTAYATFRMTERICRALKGEKGLQECAFVSLPGIQGGNEIAEALGVEFFSAPIEFTVDAALSINNPLQQLSDKEDRMVRESVKTLRDDIKLGSEFGKSFWERL